MNAPDADEELELRGRIMAATLVSAGELGYRRLTVASILERYGGYRLQFYRLYANVAEAYDDAHAHHLAKIERAMMDAAIATQGWRGGLRAGLRVVARFANEEPALMRGLLIQVHVAAGAALERRQEVLERLSRAVDSARRETRSRHSPPPLTALFMVSAIEAALIKALTSGELEYFDLAIPSLEQLICMAYFDPGLGEG